MMKSLVSGLILLAVLNGAVSQYYPYGYGYGYGYRYNNYGYYGGYGNGIGYYGNQFSCGGYSSYAYCPDRTITPGFCINNVNGCASFGTQYVCVNPGICCRTVTTTASSCPTGLYSGACSLNPLFPLACATGTCTLVGTQGLCCVTATANVNCATGTGAGTCLQTATGLTCGTGFVCTALSSGNICCPTSASATKKAGREKIICDSEKKCPDGLVCLDGRFCMNPKSFKRFDSAEVCPGGFIPNGMCSVKKCRKSRKMEMEECRDGAFCNENGFCCIQANVTLPGVPEVVPAVPEVIEKTGIEVKGEGTEKKP